MFRLPVFFPASLFIVVYGPFSLAVRRIANDVNHNPTDTSLPDGDVGGGGGDEDGVNNGDQEKMIVTVVM